MITESAVEKIKELIIKDRNISIKKLSNQTRIKETSTRNIKGKLKKRKSKSKQSIGSDKTAAAGTPTTPNTLMTHELAE